MMRAWQMKKKLLAKEWNPIQEAIECHKHPPYNAWCDRKKGNFRYLSSFPLLSFSSGFTEAGLSPELSSIPNNEDPQEDSERLTDSSPEKTDTNTVKLSYEYVDQDINALLVIRAHEAGLDLETTIISSLFLPLSPSPIFSSLSP